MPFYIDRIIATEAADTTAAIVNADLSAEKQKKGALPAIKAITGHPKRR